MNATAVRPGPAGRQGGAQPARVAGSGVGPSTAESRPVEDGDAAQDSAVVALGRIVNTHATRGELRMLPYNPDSTALNVGSVVVLQRGENRQHRRVEALRRHKHFLLLTLEGCASMTAAEALVGYDVCVPQTELPPPGPQAVYHFELLGMTVESTGGEEIGVVEDVFGTPGNDVCVVRSASREHLIPLVAPIVKDVDRERRRLVIDPLPGLLD